MCDSPPYLHCSTHQVINANTHILLQAYHKFPLFCQYTQRCIVPTSWEPSLPFCNVSTTSRFDYGCPTFLDISGTALWHHLRSWESQIKLYFSFLTNMTSAVEKVECDVHQRIIKQTCHESKGRKSSYFQTSAEMSKNSPRKTKSTTRQS